MAFKKWYCKKCNSTRGYLTTTDTHSKSYRVRLCKICGDIAVEVKNTN